VWQGGKLLQVGELGHRCSATPSSGLRR
jgi:hypothetical protein